MNLVSINIGRAQDLRVGQRTESTGIHKSAVSTPLWVTSLGLEGDFIASTRHHGGPDQAVYIYGLTDYDWWAHELGHAMSPGTFGENLTISELESSHFNIGDRLTIGALTLQVTAPRIPCATLAARMHDPHFVKRFRQAQRPGLYCRVLHTAQVQTGQAVHRRAYRGIKVSLLEIFEDYYTQSATPADLQRFLQAPLAIRARASLKSRLQKNP